MDLKTGALCAANTLGAIRLRPRITLGMGIQNPASGRCSEEKSLTLTGGISLKNALFSLIALMVLLKLLCRMREMRKEKRWRKKYKNRLRGGRKK